MLLRTIPIQVEDVLNEDRVIVQSNRICEMDVAEKHMNNICA
jgi:hypothetical protein